MGLEGIGSMERTVATKATGHHRQARLRVAVSYTGDVKKLLLLPLLSFATLAAFAEIDVAALQRERATLERNFEREGQKIDQAQEQAMIKVRSQERELRTKADHGNTNGVDLATYILTSGTKGIDFDKLAESKLAMDEVGNRVANQLTPQAEAPFQEQRDALSRRRTLELAKFDTKMLGDVEGADKQRDYLIKQAEINAQFQEKTDAVNREERHATDQLTFEQTTKINTVEAQIFVLQQKQIVAAQKKIQDEAKAGKQPDMTAYAQLASAPTPEMQKLITQRDELKNSMQTSREEVNAQYNVKRTDIQNQRDDELAKLTPP